MSTAVAADISTFYTQTVPDDFNRSLDAQRAQGAAGERVLAGMLAVDATIRVDVTDCSRGSFYLNIESGFVTSGDAPAQPPFLRILQDSAAVRRFARESSGSLTALLGALAGLGADMKLTRKRMLDLEAVDGLLRFEVTGEGGFSLQTHFGGSDLPAEPDATLRMTAAAYADLRAGRIDPQSAFLDDAIETEGDIQKIMQVAFAVVAPD